MVTHFFPLHQGCEWSDCDMRQRISGRTVLCSTLGTIWACSRVSSELVPHTTHRYSSRVSTPEINACVADISEIVREEYENGKPVNRLNGTGVQSVSIVGLVWDDDQKGAEHVR